jgi:hypothetical protein
MLSLHPISTAATPPDRQDVLAAPVRDPLWLLARQWQTRGYLADDAGSPIRVRLGQVTAPLLTGDAAAVPVAAIEPLIEAEPAARITDLDLGRLVELAGDLGRRLTDAGAVPARAVLARAFPFAPAGAGPRIQAFAGRIPDPRPLYQALAAALGADGQRGGTLPAIPGLDPASVPAVTSACRAWLGWLSKRLAPAGDPPDPTGAPAAWDPQRLEYRFRLAARLPAARTELVADEYDGAGVEWYTFDRSGFDPPRGSGATATPVDVTPVPVTYPGMPRPRFWELEDGHVNLDTLAATDAAHAVLVTFAHEYANDWFLVPLAVPPGVTTITALTVTDTFATTTEVPAVAAADGGRGPWRLWEMSTSDADPGPGAGMRLLVPPAPAPLTGDPIEDVLVLRDEMANLAWLVERTTGDGDGEPVDRYRRYLKLRPPADPAFDAGGRPEERLRYRLGTALPDYWYPLVSTTAPNGRPMLGLATLPPGATGVDDEGVRGRLVPHVPGTAIADEEALREGVQVIRQDRIVGGVLWRARLKRPGPGEGVSGLRFDIVE